MAGVAASETPGAEGPPEDVIKPVGCAHYKRKSKFVTPCCKKVYVCRFCHDEKEDHTINRKEVTELICTMCDTRQPVQADCQNCGIRFGKYTCLVCNLFDDEDKNQFHCAGCGICRIGGADKFFHCEKCNMCLPIQLKDGHKCVENVSRSNCPVCLDDIHTSRIPCHIPMCGHLLHRTCFDQLLRAGHYACPICQTSLMDMTQLWNYLDNEVSRTPMPAQYSCYVVQILCKDCHKEGVVSFHVIGCKCVHCGSYNTCRIKGPYKQTVITDEAGQSVLVKLHLHRMKLKATMQANLRLLLAATAKVKSSSQQNILNANYNIAYVLLYFVTSLGLSLGLFNLYKPSVMCVLKCRW